MISINTHLSTISAVISVNTRRLRVMRKARMGVAAVWLTAIIAGAGVSRTCGFKVTRFPSKAVMASRVVVALFVEAQSTMCGRESGRMWVSDVLPRQDGDGLKGGGRFVCRSAQSTMCRRESGRMWVVLAFRQREARLDCNG
jgi:hypothetical protein